MNRHTTLIYLMRFINKVKTDDLSSLAAASSYYLILSIFPFLIFILSVISLTAIDPTLLIVQFENLLPDASADILISTLYVIMDNGTVTLLSFGMITMLWSSLKGIRALVKGVNIAYDTVENRPFWQMFLLAFFSVLIIPLLIIISFFLLVFGEKIGEFLFEFLRITGSFQQIWEHFRLLFSVLMLAFSFALFYKFIPNIRLRFIDVIPGTLFSSIGWIVISLLYSAYINRFGTYSMLYGSIGGIMILLIWLFLSSIIVLIGAELNAFIYQESRGFN